MPARLLRRPSSRSTAPEPGNAGAGRPPTLQMLLALLLLGSAGLSQVGNAHPDEEDGGARSAVISVEEQLCESVDQCTDTASPEAQASPSQAGPEAASCQTYAGSCMEQAAPETSGTAGDQAGTGECPPAGSTAAGTGADELSIGDTGGGAGGEAPGASTGPGAGTGSRCAAGLGQSLPEQP